ncbi:hypothetical protein [Salinisphaera sp. T5B8]|uniref:hypothetical protein n=1 Tax=Salinisphaera sp. T5B8 TaxID=1304154 RepID=UPI00333F142E
MAWDKIVERVEKSTLLATAVCIGTGIPLIGHFVSESLFPLPPPELVWLLWLVFGTCTTLVLVAAGRKAIAWVKKHRQSSRKKAQRGVLTEDHMIVLVVAAHHHENGSWDSEELRRELSRMSGEDLNRFDVINWLDDLCKADYVTKFLGTYMLTEEGRQAAARHSAEVRASRSA